MSSWPSRQRGPAARSPLGPRVAPSSDAGAVFPGSGGHGLYALGWSVGEGRQGAAALAASDGKMLMAVSAGRAAPLWTLAAPC
jgi:hypothetical protein